MEVDMKKLNILIGMMIWTTLCIGCATPPETKKEVEPIKRGVFSLPAEVEKIEGDVITLRIEKPASLKTDAKLTVALAQGVIDTCYFLEGKEFLLNRTRVKVLRVSGNQVQVKAFEKTALAVGDRVTIPLEKKIIAIKDFEVIVGSSKDAARYIQEEITSLLVDSGQFSVVERAKLGTILEEIQLGQSGAIDPATVQKAGKLLGAEIILIGTLAAAGEEWNVNLRLVNTETGLIAAAIHKLGPMHEFSAVAGSIRAYHNIDGSFESGDPIEAGWQMGRLVERNTGVGGYERIYLDSKQGANGTKQSLAMAFKLGSQRIPELQNNWISAKIRTPISRALDEIKGDKISTKGSDDFAFWLDIAIEGALRDGKSDRPISWWWTRKFPITKEWQEVRIPFNSLIQGGDPKGQKANIPFDLRKVIMISWSAAESALPRGTEGTVWLDEVSFY